MGFGSPGSVAFVSDGITHHRIKTPHPPTKPRHRSRKIVAVSRGTRLSVPLLTPLVPAFPTGLLEVGFWGKPRFQAAMSHI